MESANQRNAATWSQQQAGLDRDQRNTPAWSSDPTGLSQEQSRSLYDPRNPAEHTGSSRGDSRARYLKDMDRRTERSSYNSSGSS